MFVIHSDKENLTDLVRLALNEAKRAGLVAPHVHFDTFREVGSRTRKHAVHVHLGTYTKDRAENFEGKRVLRRRPSNSNNPGDLAEYVASYREWGWFLKAVFAFDPDAVAGPYKSLAKFNEYTRGIFA